jgi:hypothetical protein
MSEATTRMRVRRTLVGQALGTGTDYLLCCVNATLDKSNAEFLVFPNVCLFYFEFRCLPEAPRPARLYLDLLEAGKFDEVAKNDDTGTHHRRHARWPVDAGRKVRSLDDPRSLAFFEILRPPMPRFPSRGFRVRLT